METEVTATTCVIYVGRTEMESRHRWGKVGRVKEEARLDGRVHEYKTADRDFWFVYRAAFEVSLPVGMTPHTFETSVQARLAYRGIRRRGEQFLPPSGSMELLVRAVEIEIKQFGFPYGATRFTVLDKPIGEPKSLWWKSKKRSPKSSIGPPTPQGESGPRFLSETSGWSGQRSRWTNRGLAFRGGVLPTGGTMSKTPFELTIEWVRKAALPQPGQRPNATPTGG